MLRCATALALERPDVRFGISPFGIYRPGMPAGVVGLDQYAALYADPLAWLEGGWVDYLAPQLYWRSTSSGQSHGALIDWWADRAAESGVMNEHVVDAKQVMARLNSLRNN